MERARQAVRLLRPVHILTVPDRFARAVSLVLVVFALGACGAVDVSAQTLAAEPLASAPPDELNPAIAALLGESGVTVASGDTALEFWWAPLTADSWESLEEGTVVGAMRVTGAFEEVRGKTVAPGVYTLRYGLQPQNGDHLGVSETVEFLLVSPAAADTSAAPLSFDEMVGIAKQTTGTSHPASLSINPAAATEAVLSSYATDSSLQGVVFEAGTIRFGLILIGTIEQ